MCLKFKKSFSIALAISIWLVLMSTISYAKVPAEIEQVAKDVTPTIANMLGVEREHYSLNSESEIKNSVVLGEGYPYYILSANNIIDAEAKNEKLSIDKLLTWSGEYIFPIQVGDMFVGAAIVGKHEGKWTLIETNSYSALNDDIKNAKDFVDSTYGLDSIDDDKVKLVNDGATGLTALSVKKGKDEYLVPIKKNYVFGYEKHSTIKISEIQEKVTEKRRLSLANGDVMGGIGLKPKPAAVNTSAERNFSGLFQSSVFLIASSICVLVIGSVFVIVRINRKKLQQ